MGGDRGGRGGRRQRWAATAKKSVIERVVKVVFWWHIRGLKALVVDDSKGLKLMADERFAD